MDVKIPADMFQVDKAKAVGAKAVVSIRDLLVLLGATDQQLKDCDERAEILAREPWRRDSLRFIPCGEPMLDETGKVWQGGFSEGEIDWSGTRFEKKDSVNE